MLGAIAIERSRYLPDRPDPGLQEKELRRHYYCSVLPLFLLRLSTRKLVLLVFVSVLLLTYLALALVERHSHIDDTRNLVIVDVGQSVEQISGHPFQKSPQPAKENDGKSPDSTDASIGTAEHKAENQKIHTATSTKPVGDSQTSEESQPSAMANVPKPASGEYRLVILIAAEGPSPDLCKVIFSAMANGYPSPIILNWEKKKKRTQNPAGLDKIASALEYLEKMMTPTGNSNESLSHNDLVIIANPVGVWWQLPPSVLIQRYFETNRLANERLALEWGFPGEMPMMQSIIAASQQGCHPSSYKSKLHCDVVPESPARPDLYGELTGNEKESLSRPKFLNSGTIMGPAFDLRRLLRKAHERRSRVKHYSQPDQALLGELFGEQEMWRDWLRAQPKGNLKFITNPQVKETLRNYEFHIGLDYSQQLSLPVAADDIHGEFVSLDNQTHISSTSTKLGIDPVRLTGLPDDIKLSQHPLAAANVTQENLPGWGQTRLYADYFSEAVPAMIQQNSLGEGDPKKRHDWWDNTWFFPYLRILIEHHLKVPEKLLPLAQVPLGSAQATYHSLPAEREKRRPRMFVSKMTSTSLPEISFENLCRDSSNNKQWFDQIFRDGRGPV